MKQNELQKTLQSVNKTELQIILCYTRVKWMRHNLLSILYRIDLWLLPPLSFFATYKAISHVIPTHPIAFYAIMSSSFMAATLTLFLIRPVSKKSAHWIKENYEKST